MSILYTVSQIPLDTQMPSEGYISLIQFVLINHNLLLPIVLCLSEYVLFDDKSMVIASFQKTKHGANIEDSSIYQGLVK